MDVKYHAPVRPSRLCNKAHAAALSDIQTRLELEIMFDIGM